MITTATIAEAVKEQLNDAVFSKPFTAVRDYRPSYKLEDMDTLHVTVVPRGVASELVARDLVQHDHSVDIGVQQAFADLTQAELDAMVMLVGEVYDHFVGVSLLGTSGGDWISGENLPLYAPEHLEELQQFTSVLTLTFRVIE